MCPGSAGDMAPASEAQVVRRKGLGASLAGADVAGNDVVVVERATAVARARGHQWVCSHVVMDQSVIPSAQGRNGKGRHLLR